MICFYDTIKKYISISLAIVVTFLLISTYSGYHILWAGISPGKGVFDIRFENGQLSARLTNSPMKEVLKEIMERSKARIWINDSIDDVLVTVEFQDVPINEGVRKILKDKNYAFVYAPGQIKEGKLSVMNNNESDMSYNSPHESYQDVMGDAHKGHISPRGRFDNAENERSSIEALIKDALENESIEKREEAVIALGESRNKNAIEVISKVLMNDPNEEVRLSSIDALLAIGNASVIQPLSVGLKDQKPSVRESTVEALAAIGGESAMELVKSAMNDEDESVRVLAQEVLEELGNVND